jgi:uncharacterized protein
MIKWSQFSRCRFWAMRGLLMLLTFACFNRLWAEQTLPKYKGHVNDFAGVLSPEEIKQLEERLYQFEDSTSVQIAVVLEKTTGGYAAFDRAMFLAREWKVGVEGKNNGLLLYIDIDDRKFQTVTADQLQDRLSASRIGQIHEDYLVPNLKNGDYALAIDQTTQAYELAIRNKFKGKATKKGKKGGYAGLLITAIILILIALTGRGGGGGGRGYSRRGYYHSGWGSNPLFWGAMGSGLGRGWGGGSSGGFGGGSSDWGGFGGGGGFNGGGAGGSW